MDVTSLSRERRKEERGRSVDARAGRTKMAEVARACQRFCSAEGQDDAAGAARDLCFSAAASDLLMDERYRRLKLVRRE